MYGTIVQTNTTTGNSTEWNGDQTVMSNLTSLDVNAEMSGLYQCTFYYTVGSSTYEIPSNDAFLVVQGM